MNSNFDKSFNHVAKGFWIVLGIGFIVSLGLIGFLIYVIIMILRFFGVL